MTKEQETWWSCPAAKDNGGVIPPRVSLLSESNPFVSSAEVRLPVAWAASAPAVNSSPDAQAYDSDIPYDVPPTTPGAYLFRAATIVLMAGLDVLKYGITGSTPIMPSMSGVASWAVIPRP